MMKNCLGICLCCIATCWFYTNLAGQSSQTVLRPRSRVSVGGGVFLPSAFRMVYVSGERLVHTWGETALRAEVSGGGGSGWTMTFRSGGQGPTAGYLPPDRYYGLNTGLMAYVPLRAGSRWRMEIGSGLMAGYAWTRRSIILDVTPITITTPRPGYGWSVTARLEFRHSLYPVIPVRWEMSRRLRSGQEIGLILTAYRSLNGYTPLVATVGWSW
jgi:hypothetical protein